MQVTTPNMDCLWNIDSGERDPNQAKLGQSLPLRQAVDCLQLGGRKRASWMPTPDVALGLRALPGKSPEDLCLLPGGCCVEKLSNK